MRTWTAASRGLGLQGGGNPTRLEAAKFSLRACWQWSEHARWLGFLQQHEVLRSAAAHRPQLLWKLQRDYLQAGLPLRDKLRWLMQHHDWAVRTVRSSVLSAIYREPGHGLATIERPEGIMTLVLSACERYAKEGEWVLSLRLAGHRVAALAFTVHQHGPGLVAHIGCLQGADSAGQQELIKTATKALEGLRPKHAVMMGLYGLLAAWGIPGVLAVSNHGHIYQSRLRRRARVQADYDAFWTELAGHPLNHRCWRLPSVLTRKPIEAVASKHRAQARRRRELEDQLLSQLAASLS